MTVLAVCWSIGPVDRGKSQSTCPVDRRAQNVHAAKAGRPVDRTVDRLKSSALWKWPRSTRPVDRKRAAALCIQSRLIGRSIGGTTVIKMTVGPVDRAVDQKGKIALSCCQRADFFWGYKYPISWLVLTKIFKSKNFHLLKCFNYKF